jgi:DtxR family Mn-dependent transcriptional regulator
MTNVTNPDNSGEPTKLSSTIEDYLSLIYVLERDTEPVVGTHLAGLLGVSPPTVTNTLKRMVRDGLIRMDEDGTHLTELGWQSARTVVRRHILMEWMMVRILPWSKLHSEAHHLEHAVSSLTETALMDELNHPQTCPYGNPLPGCEQAVANWIRLTEIPKGKTITIRRIHELAEESAPLLAFLEKNNVLPGQQAIVTEFLPFNETVTIEIQGAGVTLGFTAARYIFVELKT